MKFQDAVTSFFAKYVTFSGRASRSEYWYVILLVVIVGIVCGILESSLHLKKNLLSDLFSIAVFLPGLALVSRRLHDTDRSFWWALLNVIPVIGWVVLFIWYCTKGTDGSNRFGADPLGHGLIG